jgi:hypothetical protein
MSRQRGPESRVMASAVIPAAAPAPAGTSKTATRPRFVSQSRGQFRQPSLAQAFDKNIVIGASVLDDCDRLLSVKPA